MTHVIIATPLGAPKIRHVWKPNMHTGEAGDLATKGQDAQLKEQRHDQVRVVLRVPDELDEPPRASVQIGYLLKIQALCINP